MPAKAESLLGAAGLIRTDSPAEKRVLREKRGFVENGNYAVTGGIEEAPRLARDCKLPAIENLVERRPCIAK